MAVCILVPSETGPQVAFKPEGVVCPHLSFDEGQSASCAVHNDPQYEGSPCHIYGNSDYDPDFQRKKGKPCLVGLYLLEANKDVCFGAEKVSLDSLELVGPWPES